MYKIDSLAALVQSYFARPLASLGHECSEESEVGAGQALKFRDNEDVASSHLNDGVKRV